MMFNVFNKGLIILIGAILFSCSPQETTVPVIDLTTSHESGQLCLNEILTDYKLVRLETSPEILIPQSYRKYIGEKYILILTDDKIFQFDTEGKLIRILASHGKGPGEYSRINHFNVNSDENKLYLKHYGDRENLMVMDLDSGSELPEIPLPDKRVSKFIVADDHILCVGYKSSSLELFTMNFKGQMLDSLPNKKEYIFTSFAGRGEYLKRINGQIYFMNEFTDSLYIMDGVKKAAMCFIKVNNRYDFETRPIGDSPQISLQSENQIKLSLVGFHSEKIDGGSMVRITGSSSFLWMQKTQSVKSVSSFYHDYFEMEVDGLMVNSYDKVACLGYTSLEFKEYLLKALENSELTAEKATEFGALSASISDEDNPVLLIGRIVE
jgi:hypothetical protein